MHKYVKQNTKNGKNGVKKEDSDNELAFDSEREENNDEDNIEREPVSCFKDAYNNSAIF